MNIKRFAALASLAVLSASLLAQNSGDAKPAADGAAKPARQRPPGGPQRQGQGDRLQALATALSLTDDQKAKLKPIIQEEGEKLRALRQDTALDQEARRTKSQELRKTYAAKIKAVLTPEQAEKFDKMRGGAGRGGNRGPRPNGGTNPKPDAPAAEQK